MSWARIDDGMLDHAKWERIETETPKLWAECVALWLALNLYANRAQTDGHVTWSKLERLTPCKRAKSLAERMISVGLLDETQTGVCLHDFLDYNESAEERREKTAKKTKRQSEWLNRKRTGESGEIDASQEPSTSASHEPSIDTSIGASIDASLPPSIDGAPRPRPRPRPIRDGDSDARGRDPKPDEARSSGDRTPPPDASRSELQRASQPPRRPSPVLERPEAPIEAARRLVIAGYQQRFEDATGQPWMGAAAVGQAIDMIAVWCVAAAKGGDLRPVVDGLLDGVFADPWLTSKRWPMRMVSEDPGRFVAGSKRPSERPAEGDAPAGAMPHAEDWEGQRRREREHAERVEELRAQVHIIAAEVASEVGYEGDLPAEGLLDAHKLATWVVKNPGDRPAPERVRAALKAWMSEAYGLSLGAFCADPGEWKRRRDANGRSEAAE